MHKVPAIPPATTPLAPPANRLLRSIMILAYNNVRFFPETLKSLLNHYNSKAEMPIGLIDGVPIAVRREIYERSGALHGRKYNEGREMCVGIGHYFPLAFYTPYKPAEYRKHTRSISRIKLLAGEYLQDLRRAMMLSQEHLLENKKHHLLIKSRKHFAVCPLNKVKDLWLQLRDEQVLHAYIKQALKFHSAPILSSKAAKLYLTLKLSRV
jgi:hypothetical protein